VEADSKHEDKGIRRHKHVIWIVLRVGVFDYYHVPSMKKLFSIEEKENSLHCCDFSHSGQHFATAGRDAHVRIYDESNPPSTQTRRACPRT
jgi:WD40 repeat protein